MKSRSRRVLCLTVVAAAVTVVALAAPSLASAGGVNYVTTTQTGQSIIPGTTDVGNHCDDCATPVTFPFPVTVYGSTYTSAYVTDNGSLQLLTSNGGVLVGLLRAPDQRLRPLADPVPGRPAHGRGQRRNLHDDDGQRTAPAVRDRVADDLLPERRNGELRGHPARGLGDPVRDLRPDGGQWLCGDERDPVLGQRARSRSSRAARRRSSAACA